MTSSSGDAQQLYQELWISFAALLKAYAAAVSLALPEGALNITDRETGGLEICTASKTLSISFDSLGGSGQWSVTSPKENITASSGAFKIHPAGNVSFDGSASEPPLEMDAAAEALTARIL